MGKTITFNKDKVIDGINIVADAVKLTMGAQGQTVLIERAFGGPIATKDGATVAKNVELDAKEESVGAQLIQEVSKNVAEEAGDGTTCATVLTQALVNEGQKAIASGANPRWLRKGIEMAVAGAIESIESHATPIQSNEEIAQVSTISANGDTSLGKMIASAVDKIGKDGVISVEEAKGTKTEIDVVEGFQFDSGFLSPYFVTDPEKMKYDCQNVRVFVSEKRITNLKAMLPILEPIAQRQEPLLIIADEIDSEALATFVVNRIKGGMRVCAVKAPTFGAQRKAVLQDIATLTGATVISDDLGMSFENMTFDVLGCAKKVVVDKNHTLIVGGDGDKELIDARVAEIRTEITKAETEYERIKFQERLGRLTGGVAVIKVGGMTEPEAKEKKDRVDDAVAATRAAIAEGIVPGGGVALFRASLELDEAEKSEYDDFNRGVEIVQRALCAPINQIAHNAGEAGVVVRDKIGDSEYGYGYDVTTGSYRDLLKAGIIDPAKVVKTALRMATSCALTVLCSGCVITENPPKEPIKPAPNSLV